MVSLESGLRPLLEIFFTLCVSNVQEPQGWTTAIFFIHARFQFPTRANERHGRNTSVSLFKLRTGDGGDVFYVGRYTKR